MHDGELASDDDLGGLCLQAIPSNSKGDVSSNQIGGGRVSAWSRTANTVVRDRDHMIAEAQTYASKFQSLLGNAAPSSAVRP